MIDRFSIIADIAWALSALISAWGWHQSERLADFWRDEALRAEADLASARASSRRGKHARACQRAQQRERVAARTAQLQAEIRA